MINFPTMATSAAPTCPRSGSLSSGDIDPHRRRARDRRPSSPEHEIKLERERRKDEREEEEPAPKRKKEEVPILMRTGGAYIPPARLRMMQQSITDKSSVAYQRLAWEALKKSINGLINKVREREGDTG